MPILTLFLLILPFLFSGVNSEAARIKLLIEDPHVKRALSYPDANRERTLAEWRVLTEINAPSGKERARAERVKRLLESYKLDQVYFDSRGNLIAVRKGTRGGKAVVIDAHLDTVFKADLKIETTIRDGKLFGPGVGDDTRNIEAILASIRALNEAGIKTESDLIFVFTVEEETTMGGAQHFILENKQRIGQYVALDGGYEGITYGGIGINWYRHHFIGPGGHTRSKTPPHTAALPLARAISRIYEFELPQDPPVHINVGMIGGADVVNAKAADAWLTLDLRSTDQGLIETFERRIAKILEEEATRENMTVRTEVISKLPAAQISGNIDSPTVRTSIAVHEALGFENVSVSANASNNSNVALLAGLPAISTGAAPCGDAHALTEWCWIEPFYLGIKKVILLEIALAGLDDGSGQH